MEQYYNGNRPIQFSLHVCDVVNKDGSWNVVCLQSVLPCEIMKRIMGCTTPVETAGQDYLTWRWMLGGVFSIAGMYKNLLASNVQRKLESDCFTWKVMAPQRVRIFLWLLARVKLLINEERTRRGMSNYPFCERCGLCMEFVIHVVRDCGFVQAIWKSVFPRSNWIVFFSLRLVKWIIWNIRNKGKV